MPATTTRAHYDCHEQPIPESVICAVCEGNTAYRMQSWTRALKHVCSQGQTHTALEQTQTQGGRVTDQTVVTDICYDGMSREDAPGLRCAFCNRLDRRKRPTAVASPAQP